MKITGIVTRQMAHRGSSNEHEAICLTTGDGSYMLRRMNDSKTEIDPEVSKLVGESVQFTGTPASGYFLFESFRQQEINQEIE